MPATPFTLKRTMTAYLGTIAEMIVAVGVVGYLSLWPALALAPFALARVGTDIRSIDVERDGVRIRTPMQQQFIPFTGLGEFLWLYRWSRVRDTLVPRRSAYVQASLTGGAGHRIFGIIPIQTLSFTPRFRIAGEDNVLSAENLVALLNKCREQSAGVATA